MALSQHKNRYRIHEMDEEANMDEWLLTYSDMITLLLAFFLILISVSEPNMAMFEQLKSGLQSEITKKKVVTPLAEIKRELDSLLVEERQKELVSVDLGKNGIVMQFASSAFYGPGKADIEGKAVEIVDKVAAAIQAVQGYPFSLEVEGHTDNVPISTARFPSNWELSSARATNIIQRMIESDLDPNRLKASGFADTRPVAPNANESGQDIPENQARNRRIVIRIR